MEELRLQVYKGKKGLFLFFSIKSTECFELIGGYSLLPLKNPNCAHTIDDFPLTIKMEW